MGESIGPPAINTTGTTPGTTTYGYQVTAILGLGETAASPQGVTTQGQSPLTSVHYTVVTWAKVTNAQGYHVYRASRAARRRRASSR